MFPSLIITLTLFYSFTLGDMYGVSLAAVGMLSNVISTLTIYSFGPIVDNAKTIITIREIEGAKENIGILDRAADQSKAIGNGFSIGSACLVSIAVFGAFATSTDQIVVNILKPVELGSLLFGSMIPYLFSGLILTALVNVSNTLVAEIKKQLNEGSEELNTDYYKPCLELTTNSSLKGMIIPVL